MLTLPGWNLLQKQGFLTTLKLKAVFNERTVDEFQAASSGGVGKEASGEGREQV